MEQNFQTSFIPKRPIVEEQIVSSKPVSFLTIFSVCVFFTMVLTTGGLYFYEKILTKNITQMESDLSLAKNRFEPTKIVQLQTLDKRLNASTEILSKHIAVSPIFEALQKITMKTIAYTKFGYTLDDTKSKKVIVQMSGIAMGYRSIALQSDLFSENKYIVDPIFSNLTLNDEGEVLFDLEFLVDSDFVDYKKTLETTEETADIFNINNEKFLDKIYG